MLIKIIVFVIYRRKLAILKEVTITKSSQIVNRIPHLKVWRDLQLALVLVGLAVVAALMFVPALGLNLFWNLIIPIAPALLVIIPGIWRNICPMATIGLLPRHLRLSRRKKVSEQLRGYFTMIGIFSVTS